MTHPETPADTHHPNVRFNARLGLALFGLYCVFYAVFVLLCTFRLDVMAREFWVGVNLAIWYGFGLIGAAFVLAAVYLYLCRPVQD